ncbi:hypothetical protein [Natrinema halophilum]|uniref:Uncharacterized protein n=1 Tax=Natrinema halophilum TaxID=1699371 RepID=A0A7D5GUG4_9EURY|nr:hypothetical protein [Natrinema halophilum]QLG50046.1 hypothetical protein HYG82_14865 [Natrinema halophilum]
MDSAPSPGSYPGDSGPTVADGSEDGGSRPFIRHVSRVIDRFDDLLAFALVPLFATLLDVEKVRRALAPAGRGASINLEFAFPSSLVTLWRFATPQPPPAATTQPSREELFGSPSFGDTPGESAPTGGSPPARYSDTGGTDVTIETPVETIRVPLEAIGAEMLGWIALALVAYAVLQGLLMAGYVGGIDRRLRGEPVAIASCLVTYAPRFILYNLVGFGAFLVVLPVFILVPPLVLLAVPVIFLISYVFYPVPFLFVVDDTPFIDAFRQSARLTTAGGPVLRFGVGHLLTAVVSSVILSLVLRLGGLGFLLALLLSTPLALVLTAATVSFFQEAIDGGIRNRPACP